MKVFLTVLPIFTAFLCLPLNPAEAQWRQANGPAIQTSGSIVARIYSFTVSGTNLLAGTNGGIFLSTNNGNDWTEVNNTVFSKTTFYAFAASGTNLFAGTSRGVFLSTNNGVNWIGSLLSIPNVLALAVAGTNIFAGADGIFLSTNNGTYWARIAIASTPFGALILSGANLLAGTGGGSVYLSHDNGASWNPIAFVKTYVSTFALSGKNLFAGSPDYSAENPGGIFLSTDDGESWSSINTGLTSTNIRSLAVSGTNLFAGTYGGGVFLSTNNGASWTAVNSGLSNLKVYVLAVSGGYLFAGTYGGAVWRCPLTEMITPVERLTADLPARFSLDQNYPNPFNPSTTIEFALPHSGLATLKIFNLLGEQVAMLVNEARPAGTYRIGWNAGNLPSGVYLYRLQAGEFTETKKLILLR